MSGLMLFSILVGGYAQESFAAVDTQPDAPANITRKFEISIDHPDWEWDGLVDHAPEDGHWVLIRRAIDAMDEDGRLAREAVADRHTDDGAVDRAYSSAVDKRVGL